MEIKIIISTISSVILSAIIIGFCPITTLLSKDYCMEPNHLVVYYIVFGLFIFSLCISLFFIFRKVGNVFCSGFICCEEEKIMCINIVSEPNKFSSHIEYRENNCDLKMSVDMAKNKQWLLSIAYHILLLKLKVKSENDTELDRKTLFVPFEKFKAKLFNSWKDMHIMALMILNEFTKIGNRESLALFKFLIPNCQVSRNYLPCIINIEKHFIPMENLEEVFVSEFKNILIGIFPNLESKITDLIRNENGNGLPDTNYQELLQEGEEEEE